MVRDLNDLFYFHAVVTHNGYSAATRQLGISKSRLSRHVSRLERDLGVRLLVRSTRTVQITQMGQAVFEICETMLSNVEAAEAVTADSRVEARGVVRVSCPPALAKSLLALALPGFVERHPAVRVLVSALNQPVDLTEDHVDIAICAQTRLQADSDLITIVLEHSTGILVAAPAFVTARPPFTVDSLATTPCLSPTKNVERETWRLLGPKNKTFEVSIKPRIACNDFDVILAAAAAGSGVALLPAFVCEASLQEMEVVRVLPEWSGPTVTVHLISPRRRRIRPAVRALIDHLVANRHLVASS